MAKLSTEELLGLIGGQTEALVRNLDDRCVGIVGLKGETPSEIGSGTCITVGDRFFVATAAHVIEDYSNQELFIVHTRDPSNVWTEIIGRGAKGGGRKDPEDVAFLELSREAATALGKIFVEVSMLRTGVSDLGDDDNALVYGYPAEKVDPALFAQKKLRLQPVGYLTPTKALGSTGALARPADAAYDLFLEYPTVGNLLPSGEHLATLPAAPGMSGGSVWETGLPVSGVWAPAKCRLVAIQRSWAKNDWLRCTQIQHWLRLVRSEIPALAELLDEAFPAELTP